ncbi:uncharacterized protein BX663DRAFT_550937 [Cokeromyces recurvatus]|uniref:uncharacterized protein n=1 Tax=Cokeromyces recurvatus TaxID=90255 RepID=UPI00221F0E91|nr:uncharacterized protein BX663DRAFT_550937 [Cokeromyces recurvatus]KAI7903865.1 hypothetical protein BX663DRAFT_550937 [Cokeromyces recurvatus]
MIEFRTIIRSRHGQGKKKRDDNDTELLEVDQYTPQNKTLTTLVKARGNIKKLNDEHKDFLIELYDKDPAATVEDAIEELSANFEGIKIRKTAVHDFIKIDMNFTFKKAASHTHKRNNEENMEERYQWATGIANSNVNFLKNCVFIDESGFHINLKRTGAWGPKGGYFCLWCDSY